MVNARRRSTPTTTDEALSLKREALVSALSRVAPALASSGLIDEFRYVWFQDTVLQGYNGLVAIRLDFPTGLKAGVPGSTFAALLKTGPEDVKLSLTETEMLVRLGRSQLKVATRPAEQMIWKFPVDGEAVATIELTEAFLSGLRLALAIKPKMPRIVEHHGVSLFRDGDGVLLFTSDSQSLLQIYVDAPLPADVEKVVLPRLFVEQIITNCKAGAQLHLCDGYLKAVSTGVEIYANLLDPASLQDLPAIVQSALAGDSPVSPVPAGFADALARAAILAAKDDALVILSVKGGVLRLRGKFALGSINEEFELKEADDVERADFYADDLSVPLGHASTMLLRDNVAAFIEGSDYSFLVGTRDSGGDKVQVEENPE